MILMRIKSNIPSFNIEVRHFTFRNSKQRKKDRIAEENKKRKCDPRPVPKTPPIFNFGDKFGKWFRKHIWGNPNPKEPPPYDPRPVCSDCIEVEATSSLPPFPKLTCLYDGVMEHTGNQPPLEGEKVFLIKQYVSTTEIISMSVRERELAMLKYMETEGPSRGFQDPLKGLSSVGERMIELVDKRMHPYYNKTLTLAPLKCYIPSPYFKTTYTKPPIRIRYNLKQLQKKNFFVDLKRMDPPTDRYCTKALDLKIQEKNMLDSEKRAKIRMMLKLARKMVKEDDENVSVIKRVDDSYCTQKIC